MIHPPCIDEAKLRRGAADCDLVDSQYGVKYAGVSAAVAEAVRALWNRNPLVRDRRSPRKLVGQVTQAA
jgi:hypothetical protein